MQPQQIVWHNDIALEFVENYKLEPMLWDPKHPEYKSKPRLHLAWQRIKLKMSKDFTIDDLKRKKETLMTTYRLLNRKRREDPDTIITWFAFEALDAFLNPIYNPPGDNSLAALSEHDLLASSEDQEFRNRPIKQENPHQTASTSRKSNKRSSEVSFSYLMPERDTDIQDFDECELYTRLLAKKMRKLDERQLDIVMHEIDNIMFRVKMNSDRSYCLSQKVKKIKRPESPVFVISESNDYEEEYLDEQIND